MFSTKNTNLIDPAIISSILNYLPISSVNNLKGKLNNRIIEKSIIRIAMNTSFFDYAKFSEKIINLSYKNDNKINGISIFYESLIVVAVTNDIELYSFYLSNSNFNFVRYDIKEAKNISYTSKLSKSLIFVASDLGFSIFNVDKYKMELKKIAEQTVSHQPTYSLLIEGKYCSLNSHSHYLAVGIFNGIVNIYGFNIDKQNITELVSYKINHSLSISGLVFHQNKYLVASGKDGSLTAFENDLQTQTKNRFENEHTFPIIFMFSENYTIVTSGVDRKIKLWTMNSNKSIKTINCHNNMAFNFIYFPLYGYFLSGDASMKIVINNYYTDNFEVIKKIPTTSIPQVFDSTDCLTYIVCFEKKKSVFSMFYMNSTNEKN